MRRYPKISLIVFFLALCLCNAYAQEILTWQECIKEAARNHPDLISAQENIKESQASREITQSALYPQVDANLSASRAKTTTSTLGKRSSSINNSFSYGVDGSQLLFDGRKTVNKAKAAAENIVVSEYTYRFTSAEVRLRLRQAFIRVLRAQESLNITKQIFEIRRSNLELITLRYESGIEHKGALLTAEANLAEAEYEIGQAQRALEVAQRQLLKEMGRAQFSAVQVAGVLQAANAYEQKPDLQQLAEKNPSLLALSAQKNIELFNIRAAKADFLPSLSAQAGASRSGSRFLPQNDQLDAGVTLSLPLFEGGLRSAQVAKSRAAFNQAQADERSLKDSLVVSLEQAWASLQDAMASVGVQKKFLDAAIERAQISEAQYSLGLIKFDNWTIIEDDLVREKKAFLEAQINALLAEADWIKAKGETLENAD